MREGMLVIWLPSIELDDPLAFLSLVHYEIFNGNPTSEK
jgi:hypothetical protein